MLLLNSFIFFLPAPSIAQPFLHDSTFNAAYNFNYPIANSATIADLYEEGDGRLMVVGDYWDNVHSFNNTIRLFNNGGIDPSWNPNAGTFANGCGYLIKNDSNYFSLVDIGFIVKTHSYGTEDTAWFNTSFYSDVCHLRNRPYIFQGGTILCGRQSCAQDTTPAMMINFIRILPSGIPDTSFHHNTNGTVQKIFEYDAARLLVTGFWQMTLYDSVPVSFICRIDTSGNLDTSFHSIITTIGPSISSTIIDAYVQPDGKIIIAGAFKIQGYPDTLSLIRVNADGSLDSSFNNFNSVFYNSPNYEYVTTICPVTDGGYLVGGKFSSYQGYSRGRIAKTDANGFLDTAYFTGTGFTGAVSAPPMLNIISKSILDDKYYAAGRFTTFNGQSTQPIVRLNGLSITGMEENENASGELTVFPNPATTELSLLGINYQEIKL